METYLLPVIFTLAGGYFLFRNIGLACNEEKLRQYLKTSPKAKLWVNKLGLEKTVSLSKKVFLPLGCIVAAGLLGGGIWILITRSLNI